MRRFSLTTLSVMAAGLLQMAPGITTDVFADDSVIWIEPVVRDYGRAWKKKTAPREDKEQASADRKKSKWEGRGTREHSGASKEGEVKKAEKRKGRGHGNMRRSHKVILRAGVFPYAKAGSSELDLSQTQFWLELPDNSLSPLELKKKRRDYRLEYSHKTGGDYRLIGYNSGQIQNNTRQHLYSYYNFLAHGDKPDKKQRDVSPRLGFHNGKPMLEIVRFYDRARHRYRSRAGHKLHVRVLYKGEPLPNAPVALTTSENWQNKTKTNEQGEAAFTLIKEDFQRGILNKRKSTLFMVQAEHTENTPGSLSSRPYERERYVATLSFQVFPDSNEWEKKHIAFLVVVFTAIVSGAAIVVYRIRRRKKA